MLRWISVRDDLPKEDEEVITYSADNDRYGFSSCLKKYVTEWENCDRITMWTYFNKPKDIVDDKECAKKLLPENRYFGIGKCPRCGAVFMGSETNYCGNCGQKLIWEVDGDE